MESKGPIDTDKYALILMDFHDLDKAEHEVDEVVSAYNEALIYAKHTGVSVPALMNCIMSQRVLQSNAELIDAISKLRVMPKSQPPQPEVE